MKKQIMRLTKEEQDAIDEVERVSKNEKQHEHKWKKLYYRKQNDEKQEWVTVPDKYICEICLEIKELK